MMIARFSLVLSLSFVVGIVGVYAFVSLRFENLPEIQGVVVPEARPLAEFTLLDQYDRQFTRNDLQGNWHIISYGFTDCPDICPTTLNKLARVAEKLDSQGISDVSFVFYTVDAARDTTEHLSNYLQFFRDDFIGLTWTLESNHIPFETSLGIVSSIDPLSVEESKSSSKGYRVSHGVFLYILNPEGKLQAVLKPRTNNHGLQYFTVEQIYRDYMAIRAFYG